jgi:AcrR family transcriptional regulator
VPSKDAILDAAIQLADERGLEAVSMRSVAGRVGVTPMALYPYVGSKATLLDGMMGRLLGELLPVLDPDAGWRERLRGLAYAARSLSKRHPWVARLQLLRPAIEPDAVRVVDAIYQALLEAGVPEADVPRMERMISTFIIGFGASEAEGRFGPGSLDPRGRRGQLPEGHLPGHYRLARMLDQKVDWDAEFEADLADLERLVIARAQQAVAADDGPAGTGGGDAARS